MDSPKEPTTICTRTHHVFHILHDSHMAARRFPGLVKATTLIRANFAAEEQVGYGRFQMELWTETECEPQRTLDRMAARVLARKKHS